MDMAITVNFSIDNYGYFRAKLYLILGGTTSNDKYSYRIRLVTF